MDLLEKRCQQHKLGPLRSIGAAFEQVHTVATDFGARLSATSIPRHGVQIWHCIPGCVFFRSDPTLGQEGANLGTKWPTHSRPGWVSRGVDLLETRCQQHNLASLRSIAAAFEQVHTVATDFGARLSATSI